MCFCLYRPKVNQVQGMGNCFMFHVNRENFLFSMGHLTRVNCLTRDKNINFNPFNTKPMAKLAVKLSIMRVVKFMSSWDNDFMSWPKHHQLFFGGQSVQLPLSLPWFSWLPPGGYQGLSMWEIWSKHSQSFDVWRTLTATGVKGYRNRVTCISQIMRPQGPLMPCTPQVLPSKYCQR